MTMFQAVSNAFAGKVHKQQVGERIDNLCSVCRNNIVLRNRQ